MWFLWVSICNWVNSRGIEVRNYLEFIRFSVLFCTLLGHFFKSVGIHYIAHLNIDGNFFQSYCSPFYCPFEYWWRTFYFFFSSVNWKFLSLNISVSCYISEHRHPLFWFLFTFCKTSSEFLKCSGYCIVLGSVLKLNFGRYQVLSNCFYLLFVQIFVLFVLSSFCSLLFKIFFLFFFSLYMFVLIGLFWSNIFLTFLISF